MKPREAEGEIDQIPVIYSVESETDEDYQMGSKIKLVDNADDSYEINLTSVKVNKGEVRRRVRTEFTRQEVNKLFEFKKNNIQLQKGRELEETEAHNKDPDDDYLRVFTGSNPIKSRRSFNRSNTMVSDRSRSINKSFAYEEKKQMFRFNPVKFKRSRDSKPEEDLSRKRSINTSIDKPNLNTSILKELSQEYSGKEENSIREKSISDPVREFKIKYKSDNVLNQLGRVNDEADNFATISINDFEVIQELGKGKFGKVLKVTRKINGDEFAVKLIPIKNSLDKNSEANLNSESEIFKTISNKFVVSAYYW